MADVGVVVIGRNEGERLRTRLASLDTDTLTPLQGLTLLAELSRQAKQT